MYQIIKDSHPELEYSLGWAPPPVADPRNYRLEFEEEAVNPPPKASVKRHLPACWNQSKLGACTSFAANAMRWQLIKKLFEEHAPGITDAELMAFLFEYYNTRLLQGTANYDSGGSIQGSFKAMAKYGLCFEKDWPYDISKFKEKPPEAAYVEAEKHQILQYFEVGSSLNNLKACIASGYGFSFGFTVKSSFMDAEKGPKKDGIMRKAGFFERTLGGHAVFACEYDDAFVTHEKKPGAFLIRNSWSPEWGPLSGYFWMPYNVIDSDAADEYFTARTSE